MEQFSEHLKFKKALDITRRSILVGAALAPLSGSPAVAQETRSTTRQASMQEEARFLDVPRYPDATVEKTYWHGGKEIAFPDKGREMQTMWSFDIRGFLDRKDKLEKFGDKVQEGTLQGKAAQLFASAEPHYNYNQFTHLQAEPFDWRQVKPAYVETKEGIRWQGLFTSNVFYPVAIQHLLDFPAVPTTRDGKFSDEAKAEVRTPVYFALSKENAYRMALRFPAHLPGSPETYYTAVKDGLIAASAIKKVEDSADFLGYPPGTSSYERSKTRTTANTTQVPPLKAPTQEEDFVSGIREVPGLAFALQSDSASQVLTYVGVTSAGDPRGLLPYYTLLGAELPDQEKKLSQGNKLSGITDATDIALKHLTSAQLRAKGMSPKETQDFFTALVKEQQVTGRYEWITVQKHLDQKDLQVIAEGFFRLAQDNLQSRKAAQEKYMTNQIQFEKNIEWTKTPRGRLDIINKYNK